MMFKSPAAPAAAPGKVASRRVSSQILLLVLPLLAVASTAALVSDPLLDPDRVAGRAGRAGGSGSIAPTAAAAEPAAPQGSGAVAAADPAELEPAGMPAAAADGVPVPAANAAIAAAPAEPARSAASTGIAAATVWRGMEGLSSRILRMALAAVSCARAGGVAGRSGLLTVIDYSLPSTSPRLWVLDLARQRVLFHELVAHGAGSGDVFATRFSNTADSRESSLGLFLTGGTYEGGNGYSLRLRGLDPGLNDRAEQRNIVMHGAWYVSADHARQYGRLGRSWGCPALPLAVARQVIDAIKDGSFVFSYSPVGATALAASHPGGCSPASPAGPAGGAATATTRSAAAARSVLKTATVAVAATAGTPTP